MIEFSHKLVTSTMDIEGQAAALQKKIEKLELEIRNKVLTKKQKDNKQDKIKELKEQIEALESQLTTLKVIKINRTIHK